MTAKGGWREKVTAVVIQGNGVGRGQIGGYLLSPFEDDAGFDLAGIGPDKGVINFPFEDLVYVWINKLTELGEGENILGSLIRQLLKQRHIP